jgi:uncharacterized protein YggE
VGAHAQEGASRGIAVTGKGEAKARPNTVELMGTVTGEAELASDAITKFRDNRERAFNAIEALKLPNVSLSGGGVSINAALSAAAMQAAVQGMPSTDTTGSRLQVSEPLQIKVEGVDALTTEELLELLVKIVDAGKDAGVAIGPTMTINPYVYDSSRGQPQSLATFRMANIDDLREQAYEAAIRDAREQAQRLAKLAGVKLGRVTSVRVGQPAQSSNPIVVNYYGAPQSDPDEYSSSKLEDITVKVTLQVEFAIE